MSLKISKQFYDSITTGQAQAGPGCLSTALPHSSFGRALQHGPTFCPGGSQLPALCSPLWVAQASPKNRQVALQLCSASLSLPSSPDTCCDAKRWPRRDPREPEQPYRAHRWCHGSQAGRSRPRARGHRSPHSGTGIAACSPPQRSHWDKLQETSRDLLRTWQLCPWWV